MPPLPGWAPRAADVHGFFAQSIGHTTQTAGLAPPLHEPLLPAQGALPTAFPEGSLPSRKKTGSEKT